MCRAKAVNTAQKKIVTYKDKTDKPHSANSIDNCSRSLCIA